jgi:hypothetical protein
VYTFSFHKRFRAIPLKLSAYGKCSLNFSGKDKADMLIPIKGAEEDADCMRKA